jgi:hypothetical protein
MILKSVEEFISSIPVIEARIKNGLAGGKPVQLELGRPSRNTLSNRKLHAMLGDIRKHAVIELDGAKIPLSCYEPEVCKAFLVRWFDIEMKENGEPLRKAGRSVVDPITGDKMYVRPSTTDFSQSECCAFIEWLYAWGTCRGVIFSDPAMAVYEEYARQFEVSYAQV